MRIQAAVTVLALAAATAAQYPSPPVPDCPPQCTISQNLTASASTFSDCTSTRWRHVSTTTTTTTTTAPPTACPYKTTVTLTPSYSACPNASIVTTTAPPTACPYETTVTLTPSYSACPNASTVTTTAPPTACPYQITETITTTSVQTVTATPTPSASPYCGPFVDVLTFASADCSNAGVATEGYPPSFARYALTIDTTSSRSACTKFTGGLSSFYFTVVGSLAPSSCSLIFYDTDYCEDDSNLLVNVNNQADQCWEITNPRSMQIFC